MLSAQLGRTHLKLPCGSFKATHTWATYAVYPVSSTLSPVRLHLALVLIIVSARAFSQAQNRNLILLDPAHGGQDRGVSFNGTPEKDLTLVLAANLRALLADRNFTVASTRDAELPANTPLLSTDQRAGTANHLRASACLILHASASGNGIHIVTSSLPPLEAPAPTAIPWDTAQAASLPQSQRLANTLGLAMLHLKLPVTLTTAALRPLDNLTCPAVAIEIAPLATGGHVTPPTDPAYQHRLAEAVAVALTDWRNSLSAAGGAQP